MKTNYKRKRRWNKDYFEYSLKNWRFKSVSHQERKYNCAHKKYVRAKRSCKRLIDTYDDIWPSRFYGKSWKDYTKYRRQYEKSNEN